MKKQIAIDGPAGAGKSTVAKAVAQKLHMNYMDTGAMYRAVAYDLLRRNVCLQDIRAVEQAMEKINLEVIYRQGEQRVLIDDRDVTSLIRTPEISKGASAVGAVPAVRIKLVELQRKTAEKYDIVMD